MRVFKSLSYPDLFYLFQGFTPTNDNADDLSQYDPGS